MLITLVKFSLLKFKRALARQRPTTQRLLGTKTSFTHKEALKLYTEQYGIADLSESLEHICPQVWVLHDRFQASMIVFQNTFRRKKEKRLQHTIKKNK